jgi:hypothetical protein
MTPIRRGISRCKINATGTIEFNFKPAPEPTLLILLGTAPFAMASFGGAGARF